MKDIIDKKITDEGGMDRIYHHYICSHKDSVTSIYIYYEVWRNVVNNNNSNHMTILLINRDLLSIVITWQYY